MEINTVREQFFIDLSAVSTLEDFEEVKIKYLGKKGPINELMKNLKNISSSDRPGYGKSVNDLKEELSVHLGKRELELISQREEIQLKEEKIDVTLPGCRRSFGRKHIVNQTLDLLLDILIGMGFSVQYGPDIDSDYYNFEVLNFPSDHPARDMQDTFYITSNMLLRTHTSNIQARIMEGQKPPIRVIAPGRAYRNEAITARSHVFFHQIEGFYVDEGVTFSTLLATMRELLQKFFGSGVELRFRPSFFPFVEPGMEVDILCSNCNGQGCSLCKNSGWLEVAGAGMIHPEVLKNGGIDPEVFSGYAWGMGIERLILLKHGVKDIRLFTENDLRFLQQFSSN